MSETAKTVQIEAPGGPEQMRLVDLALGAPGEGQVLIRQKAAGLNFIDVYQRTGMYPLNMPAALGMEGAGVIEAVGPGVTHLAPGDRAAYAAVPPGGYAEARVMPATQVCKLPEAISCETGAAMMLKGLTAQYLLRRTWPLNAGDWVLFHAAAGGVGLIVCQWAKALGLRLIGTAGTDEKCALAKSYGAEHVINYREQDFVAAVREITGGQGVKVVMDAVGKDTWEGSLDSLAKFGLMLSFGNASGKTPPLEVGALGPKGCLYVTRPTLFGHISDRETCQKMADELFDMVASGKIEIRIDQRYPLAEIAEAHRALEARQTTGATILTI